MKRIVPPLLFLLAGCAASELQQPTGGSSACRNHFRQLDSAVAQAGVRDYGATPIPGFPYLRVNRFLASFSDEVNDPARFDAWVGRLAQLDRLSRQHEIASLSDTDSKQLLTDTDRCRHNLIREELASVANRTRLQKQARVPDDYLTAWRVLGLYPISALFVKAGIARWHKEARERYALPTDSLPIVGRPRHWTAPTTQRLSSAEVAALLDDTSDNPLAIPEPIAEQRDRLFTTFAPQWIIDTVDENDLPGTPRYTANGPRPASTPALAKCPAMGLVTRLARREPTVT